MTITNATADRITPPTLMEDSTPCKPTIQLTVEETSQKPSVRTSSTLKGNLAFTPNSNTLSLSLSLCFLVPTAAVVGADCLPPMKKVFYSNPNWNTDTVHVVFPNGGDLEMTACGTSGLFYRQIAATAASSWVIFRDGGTYDNKHCTSGQNYDMTFDSQYAKVYSPSSCDGVTTDPWSMFLLLH